ncbi:MAG: hypothetical protein UU73_C0005G0013 [Candidatus Daviesbacteria bacterium GW2011_GWA1_41_61]|uniref:Uncharacterized protein n=1 Tax=Candidatus Daviesbacteria bacterium GW2011_GWA2_40_9 TaxID=1618424 RepID=A0A0G0U3J8_9BACT|nr:MAG: hypothetical protein UU29_C0003G0060 [Candidatus Daviesbacteria bacterium GW2011_GWA2_40_9]KKR92683.1 MAG: hypothetical protein UU44_C0005G0013 [Candidatus Daviesbacteria bacterium GW2011_GWB1_41_15]KKS14614.1 MAG: hypothetical protein UU73_C0005G0013 [Candidatus Daviesbacteria bacterium GW2011_GWA1_41_61]
MNKAIKKKLLIISIILGLGLFVGYIYKYQQLINEGSYLADEHCIKINPLIIDRKNKYLDQYNLILKAGSDTATAEEYHAALDKYMQASDVYQKEEKLWLDKQRIYLDSKAFNLLIHSYIKEAGQYQYEMYKADYESSVFLSTEYKEKDPDEQRELSNRVMEAVARSKEAEDKYDSVWEREKGRSDWIYSFVQVPSSKCSEENYDFPALPELFAPPIPVSNDETKV